MFTAVKKFLDEVNTVESIGDLEDLLQVVLNEYGIHHYICTNMYGLECLSDRKPIFGNWDTKWVNHYLWNGFFMDDAVTQFSNGLNDDGRPYYWSELISEKNLTKTQARIFEEAWDSDLKEGLVIPLRVSRKELAMVSMAGRNFKQDPQIRGILHSISIQAHRQARELLLREYGTRLMPDRLGVLPHPKVDRLTPTELAIIKYLAEDKTPGDIATITGVSINTINRHSANIKQKLEVRSLYGAVAKAIRYGLFH